MPLRLFSLVLLMTLSPALHAQSETHARYQLYGGYALLSNSFNGVPGSRQTLNGWDAALGFPPTHGLRFKLDTFAYRGTNLGAPQDALFILAGGQFGKKFGREFGYVQVLAGNGSINKNWGANETRGLADAFSTLLGGGLDTPITHRIGFRVDAGYQHTSFEPLNPKTLVAYQISGLPHSFARITTGVFWNF
jgi:hypothetical protein